MGYLGLDQTEVKDDNMFKRMFWPSDHAGEADTLGKQGFWVCLLIAAVSLITVTLQGHWILALLTAAFYLLGGIGVREHDQPAAVLVAAIYILNEVSGLFVGLPPGLLGLGATVLLIANIRGTWIAAKWAASGQPDVMPDRFNTTFTDKLVDQMPAKVWPKARVPFYCLAGVYVALTALGMVMLAMHVPGTRGAAKPEDRNTMTVELGPQR